MRKKLLLAFLILLVYTAVTAQTAYQASIDQWHARRTENLKKETGWLNLAGLYWLQPGKNSFGTGPDVTIKFPEGSLTADAGYFEWSGKTVTLHYHTQTPILINGAEKNGAVVYHADSTRQPQCSYGSLRWTIIKREDKIGIRLRDLESPQLKTFNGIERFAVDSSYRVTATLQKPFTSSIMITNVLGQTNAQATPGKLHFTLQGKNYTLDALEENGELFIIFGDATSGVETYPSGRFLYAAKPGADGTTVLDFNKAYNPPCAFTPYATCPLPPQQNILPLAITAGEKNYGGH